MTKDTVTLDDQIKAAADWYYRFRNRSRAGSGCRKGAFVCAAAAVVGSLIGIPLQYHQSFLSDHDILAILILLASWGAALIGGILAIISLLLTRGRRGWIALILTSAILAASILLTDAFPSYGLGNIH